MRYHRLTYRYARLVRSEPRPFGDPWLGGRGGVVLAQPRWRPPTDVHETEDGIHITVELAGVEAEELDVLLYDDAVVVEGTRRLPRPEGRGVYHAVEIRQGPFRLEVPLPAQVQNEDVEARYERGLLQLTLVKVAPGEVHAR